MRTAGDLRPTSTIEIRDVRTGLRLRRLEGGGVPVGFVHVPTVTANKRHRFHGSSSWDNNNDDEDDIASLEEEEHRLISTCGPNTCLKLWSWNRNRCVANDDENENQNSDPRSTHDPIDETMPLHFPANESATGELMGREQYKTVLDGGRCIQQWFLDRFNTVLPIPAAAAARTRYHSNRQSDDSGSGGACVILVAVINEPSKDSFAVWKTSSPRERMVFRNTHPYEIQFSPDGSKIASVDDFNTVKVWRLSDGELLKTFSGGEDDDNRSQNYKSSNSNENRCSHCRIPVGNDNNTTSYDGEEEDSDEISVSYAEEDFSGSDDGGGLFPIHELVFSKDSSTVAVISRCYNEVHLFST
jgi:WD40 repeat protein